MAITLRDVLRAYHNDQAFHDEHRNTRAARDASLATIRPIVERFVDAQIDIEAFRKEITQAFHQTNDWGATGFGWLMEINKLANNRAIIPSEGDLRESLRGLRAANLGERIELFHSRLLEERKVLKELKNNAIANPGNSAFLISLPAFWLDRDAAPPIYYASMRRGLRMLLDAGLLPGISGLPLSGDSVDVRSNAAHQAVLRALETIAAADPSVARGNPYWQEEFLKWVRDNPGALLDEPDSVIEPPTVTIEHAPLKLVDEARLRVRIAELRRRLLVDEAVIRRIYHALLAGHVILSGPPGTGKTELARWIPELLWQGEDAAGANPEPFGPTMATARSTTTAYAAKVVTATDEWSVRTLIGGLHIQSVGGQAQYTIRYGHLTRAIFDNLALNETQPGGWKQAQRRRVRARSALDGQEHEFCGVWLVIDEFNRAPIDLALGEAITALGGGDMLRVPTENGDAELPLPQDFRIIGTLNSFDRNYLNQISEALKRRFTFIEILPPSRKQRNAERAIVLARALRSIAHLDSAAIQEQNGQIIWQHVVRLVPVADGGYTITWEAPRSPFADVFDALWNAFEVIRIYRRLGTAQAIALVRQVLIAGIAQSFQHAEAWRTAADIALCDTIADQLQVLMPDELEMLIAAFSTPDPVEFAATFNQIMQQLQNSPRRLTAQVHALKAVGNETAPPGQAAESLPTISAGTAAQLFHLSGEQLQPREFVQRLQTLMQERGL